MTGKILFIHPAFARTKSERSLSKPLTAAQLVMLWSHRAQKASAIQTSGIKWSK